jgi:hypothetical protein
MLINPQLRRDGLAILTGIFTLPLHAETVAPRAP